MTRFRFVGYSIRWQLWRRRQVFDKQWMGHSLQRDICCRPASQTPPRALHWRFDGLSMCVCFCVCALQQNKTERRHSDVYLCSQTWKHTNTPAIGGRLCFGELKKQRHKCVFVLWDKQHTLQSTYTGALAKSYFPAHDFKTGLMMNVTQIRFRKHLFNFLQKQPPWFGKKSNCSLYKSLDDNSLMIQIYLFRKYAWNKLASHCLV